MQPGEANRFSTSSKAVAARELGCTVPPRSGDQRPAPLIGLIVSVTSWRSLTFSTSLSSLATRSPSPSFSSFIAGTSTRR